jgi:hypothetical protein
MCRGSAECWASVEGATQAQLAEDHQWPQLALWLPMPRLQRYAEMICIIICARSQQIRSFSSDPAPPFLGSDGQLIASLPATRPGLCQCGDGRSIDSLSPRATTARLHFRLTPPDIWRSPSSMSVYSWRRAEMGSRFMARKAGKTPAAKEVTSNVLAAAAIATGSAKESVKSMCW